MLGCDSIGLAGMDCQDRHLGSELFQEVGVIVNDERWDSGGAHDLASSGGGHVTLEDVTVIPGHASFVRGKDGIQWIPFRLIGREL